MKLATYDDGSRDGQLVVVSRDLGMAHYASHIATRMQQVLDDWNFLAPQLNDLAQTLDHGRARHAFAFEPTRCLAPLPRAAHWSEVSAYAAVQPGQPVDAVAQVPGHIAHLPGDSGRGARSEVRLGGLDAAGGALFAPGWAVLTGDIAHGASPAEALEGVRLAFLVNAWHLPSAAMSAPGGRGRWPVACSAVAVTLDELGPAWAKGRLSFTLQVAVSGVADSIPSAAASDSAFSCKLALTHPVLHVGQLLACLARDRDLGAGTLVSSGPLSYAGEPPPGLHAAMQAGQRVSLDALDAHGASLFGAIEQVVVVESDPSSPASRGV